MEQFKKRISTAYNQRRRQLQARLLKTIERWPAELYGVAGEMKADNIRDDIDRLEDYYNTIQNNDLMIARNEALRKQLLQARIMNGCLINALAKYDAVEVEKIKRRFAGYAD